MQVNVSVNITGWPADALYVGVSPLIMAVVLSMFVSVVGHWKRSPVAYLVASVLWMISGSYCVMNAVLVPGSVGFVLMLVGLMYVALAVAEFMSPSYRGMSPYQRVRGRRQSR